MDSAPAGISRVTAERSIASVTTTCRESMSSLPDATVAYSR